MGEPSAPGGTPPRAAVAWVAAILLAAALFVYAQRQALPLLGDRGTGIVGMAAHSNDFKHIYLGAWLQREGVSPFDAEAMLRTADEWGRTRDPRFARGVLPYVYLPFTGVVLAPLTLLPFDRAVVAWLVVNHILLLGTAGGLAMLAPRGWRLATAAALVGWAALAMPVYRQNAAGQLNMVLLAGFALVAWLVVDARWKRLPGPVAAFFALFKVSPGLLLLWFALRRDMRAATGFVAGAAAMALASLLVVPFGSYLDFLPELRAMGYGRSTWEQFGQTFWRDPYNISINATLHRLLASHPGSGVRPWLDLGWGTANALTYAVTLALMAVAGRSVWRSRGDENARAPSLAVAVVMSLLIPSLMWDHYLVQLLVPAVLLWWAPGVLAWQRVLVAAAMVLAAWWIPQDAEPFRSGVGLLVMSAKLAAPLALLLVGLYQLRLPRGSGGA